MQPSKAVLILSGFLIGYRIPVQKNISGLIFRSYLLHFFVGWGVIGGYTLNLTFETNNWEIRRISSFSSVRGELFYYTLLM